MKEPPQESLIFLLHPIPSGVGCKLAKMNLTYFFIKVPFSQTVFCTPWAVEDLPVPVPILPSVYPLPPPPPIVLQRLSRSENLWLDVRPGRSCLPQLFIFYKKENQGPGKECVQGHTAGGLWWILSYVCISFCGCCNKSQCGWLRTTDFYSVTVLEARV